MNEITTTSQFDLKKAEGKAVEFIPFGASEKIKLTVAMIQNMLAKPTRNGHKCTEGDAIKFMMLCRSRALNPFEGDAFIVGYDGKDGPEFSLITAHQAFLKRAEVCEQFDGMLSGVVIKDDEGNIHELEGDFFEEGQTVIGGWAKVFRKDRKYPTYRKLRLSSFRKNFGVWVSNPEGMIVKTAESDALRSTFPTKLGGLYSDAELPIKSANVTEVASPEFTVLPEHVKEPATLHEATKPEPPPVPNPELGARKKPKAGRDALIDRLREKIMDNGSNDDDFMAVIVKRQFVPPGTRLEELTAAQLNELMGDEIFAAIIAEASK